MEEKNSLNKFIIAIAILFIIFFAMSIFFVTGFGSTSSEEDIQDKAKSEILYLDSKILYLLNSLNNIIDANYYVSTQKVNENQDSSQSSETSGSKEESGGEQQGSSSSQSSGEQSSNSGESGSSKTGNDVTKTSKSIPDVVSQRDSQIDWVTLEGTIQTIYSSWSVIILDLYKLNVNNEDILSFSSSLDDTMQSIIQKDKKSSLTNLATLYSYLPRFLEGHTKDNKINSILKVKSNIINAYSVVEEGDWQKITEEINSAESNFNGLLNTVPENQNSIYNINKAYIVLKELQNSLDTQDTDIFYVKYRNIIAELNVLT